MINEVLNSPTASVFLLGIIGSIAYSIKDVPVKIWNFIKPKLISRFIFTAHIYEYDDLFTYIEQYLYTHHAGQYREVQAYINNANFDIQRRTKKIPKVRLRQAPNVFILKYKGRRIFISKQAVTLNHATSFSSMFGYTYNIYGYKAKEEILDFLQLITNEHYSNLPKNAITVKTHDEYGNWSTANIISVKTVDKIILEGELKNRLLEDLDDFINSKEWYIDNSIPYKRTYCFHGKPGTGKTTLSLGIASYLDRDVYAINLSSLKYDSSLQQAFSNIPPCSLILFEDIDAAFVKRNVENGSISFSALLNCLDGVFYKEGVVICITTNHIEKLDPALLRAGRIDIKEEIGYPTTQQIENFLQTFYRKPIKINHSINNDKVSMSTIQEICIANKTSSSEAYRKIISILDEIEINQYDVTTK